MEKIISLEISGKLESVKLVTLSIRSIFSCFMGQVDWDWIDETEIALAEAITNIVKHGYRYQKDTTITIELYKSKVAFEFHLIDMASPYTIDEIPSLDFDEAAIDTLPESGMGIYLISECMNDLKYIREKNQNRLILVKHFLMI